jgi:broad-specificity NMP kinase
MICNCGDPAALGVVHLRIRPCFRYVERQWVGFTTAERDEIVPMLVQSLVNHDDKTMIVLLRAILIDVEKRLEEKNT